MVGTQSEFFLREITGSFLKSKISEYLIDRLGNLLAMDFDLRQPGTISPNIHIEKCIQRLLIYFSANPQITVVDDFEGIFTLFTVAIQESDGNEGQTFNPELGQNKSSSVSAAKNIKKPEGNHVSKITSMKSVGAGRMKT